MHILSKGFIRFTQEQTTLRVDIFKRELGNNFWR